MIENLEEYVDTKRASRALHFPMSALKRRLIDTADCPEQIDILAVKAQGLLDYRHHLRRLVQSGCRFRVLVVSPSGKAARLIDSQRPNAVYKYRAAAHELLEFRKALCSEFGQSAAGQFECKQIDWVPSVTLFIQRESTRTLCWCGVYTPDFASPSGEKWFLMLSSEERDSSAAVEYYREQFERLWEKAEDLSTEPSARSEEANEIQERLIERAAKERAIRVVSAVAFLGFGVLAAVAVAILFCGWDVVEPSAFLWATLFAWPTSYLVMALWQREISPRGIYNGVKESSKMKIRKDLAEQQPSP